MPIYEYRCTACDRISEEWVRNFDAPDEQTCEHCGKPAHRIMSHTSFQLKGGGWYVTEYGSHKSAPAESGASEASTSTGTAEAASTTEAAAPAASGEASTSTPSAEAAPKAAATSESPAASSSDTAGKQAAA